MQPDHDADELQTLLREEYGAPPLDKQFSAELLARLQAEAASRPSSLLTSAKPRRSLLAICLGFAAIAASIVAIIWIANQGTPATNHEVARRDKTKSDRLELLDLNVPLSRESKPERVDHMSLSKESESIPLSESLSDRSESESKYYSESRLQRKESLAAEERAPTALSQAQQLSVALPREWPSVSAAAALADRLYVVDSGRLYEVNPADGSRRIVGEDRWQNTAAMGAAGGYLYLVCDNQLYEVDPKTEKRRRVGIPGWANTKAIVAVGDKLHIVSNGWLHRVNPGDGSYEVLHSKTESPNPPGQPKP